MTRFTFLQDPSIFCLGPHKEKLNFRKQSLLTRFSQLNKTSALFQSPNFSKLDPFPSENILRTIIPLFVKLSNKR